MKESWQFYDYLKRWWILLLVGCLVGVVSGYLLNQPTVMAKSYSANTTATIRNAPIWPYDPLMAESTPPLVVTLDSGAKPTLEDATQALRIKTERLANYSGAAIDRGEIIVDQLSAATDTWKSMILGGVIGGLLAIGFAYVWDDTRAYRKH